MEGARVALEQARYGDAVKACKQILKQDRSNYDGFVLLGTALARSGNNLDQAEMSFKKAISLDSSALPAYKGLVELREAAGTQEQVAESYEALAAAAKAAGETPTAMESSRKAALVYSRLQSFERSRVCWREVLEMSSDDEKRHLEALCGVVDAEAALMDRNIQEFCKQASEKLAGNEGVSREDILSVAQEAWARTTDFNSLESHVKEVALKLPHNEIYQGLLLQILLHKTRATTGEELSSTKQKLASQCMAMISKCPSKPALETLLAIAEDDDSEDVFQISEHLEFGNSGFYQWLGKHVAHLYPGMGVTMVNGSKQFRKELALWDISSGEHSISGWRTLAREELLQGSLEKAVEAAKRCLNVVALRRKSFGLALKAAEQELRLVQANILLSEKKVNEASRVFLSVAEEAKGLPESRRTPIIRDAFQGIVKLSLAMKQTEAAKVKLNDILEQDPENHWALSERGWLEYESGSLNEAQRDLEKAVASFQSSAIYHYRLGRVYWEMEGLAQKASNEFLESAKLDPNQATPFIYLGHYYKKHGHDSRRATRCYQKAVSLEPENESVGELLCDILDSGGQYELEKKTCEEAAKKSPRAFWASRRLGFILVAQKLWSSAVASIQYALRGFPQDARLWEALGLSYKKLGMFSAALKAFKRAFDLDNLSLFSALEMGAIQLTQSLYSKASLAYRQALQIFPGDQTATYGLASALLGEARDYLSQGAFPWCASSLKEAMLLAGRNRLLHGHLVSAWKQLGDANLLYAQSLPFDTELGGKNAASTQALGKTWRDAVDSWQDERILAAKEAAYAYKCAIHLQPQEASLYKDLAMAIEYGSSLNKRQDSTKWSEAEVVVCSGLQLDGANADMWVTLGLVTQHKGLQQHSFIQALRLDQNHAPAWAYLGQLYMNSGDQRLAQYCFDRARSADSSLALTWFGMSALQSSFQTKHGLLEAFANCSCAVQLSSTVDSRGGFGQLAARTQQLDLPEVNVALRKAIQRQPLEAAVHNLNGLSLESRNEFNSAILSYRNARHASSGSKNLQNIITSNLARALCKAGQANAAASEYQKLHANGALSDLSDVRGFSIALKQAGKGHDAELVLTKAMERSKQDSQYPATLLLLSKFIYFNRGPAPALDLLLRAPDALFSAKEFCLATLALGITSREQGPLSAALTRCRHFMSSEQAPDAYLLLSSGHQTAGLTRNLIRALHMHPQSDSLRARLGQILLTQSGGLSSDLVEHLCHSPSIVSDTSLTRKLSSRVLADSSLASGSPASKTLTELQRLVHSEPSNVEARYCHTLCLFEEARRLDFPRHLSRAIPRLSTIVLRELTSSTIQTYMRFQLELCVSECELRSGSPALALHHARAAASAGRSLNLGVQLAAILQIARCYILSNDHSSARASVSGWLQQHQSSSSCFPWQLSLLELELSFQPGSESSRLVSRFRQGIQQGESQRWLALLELVLARVMLQSGDLQRSEEAAAEALQWWPSNSFLHFFHGAVCMELVKSGANTLGKAISSLTKAVNLKEQQGVELPGACALLARAESSRDGSKASSVRKWASNLRKEFTSWPSDNSPMPAEMYFQMALLAKQKNAGLEAGEFSGPEMSRSWRNWLQTALHLNPACQRYWHLATQAKQKDVNLF